MNTKILDEYSEKEKQETAIEVTKDLMDANNYTGYNFLCLFIQRLETKKLMKEEN